MDPVSLLVGAEREPAVIDPYRIEVDIELQPATYLLDTRTLAQYTGGGSATLNVSCAFDRQVVIAPHP